MRALFLIPKDPPPRLEGGFSPDFQRFVERCLQKVHLCCRSRACPTRAFLLGMVVTGSHVGAVKP